MPAKHFRAALIAACAFLSTQAHAAAPEDFIFSINATNTETGEAAKGSVYMYLNPDKQVPVVDETLADGTLHRSFLLTYIIYQSPFSSSSWTLNSGSDQLKAISNPDNWTSAFEVNQYLYTDGRSSLSYSTIDRNYPQHHSWEESKLDFTLDCACNNLFTSTVTSHTFAKYDTISGKGSYGAYFYYADSDTTETLAEKHISFAAPAVPEPGAVSLMLAGMSLIGARRWSASRKA